MNTIPFIDRLNQQIQEKRSAIVVGMDPRPDLLPPAVPMPDNGDPEGAARGYAEFARGILEHVAPFVVAVKFQSAFYEKLGPAGLEVLNQGLALAKDLGLSTILDVKRGDIGSTAQAYAEATLGRLPGTPGPMTDAVTVNPYLGEDSLRPFLDLAAREGKGLFVLVKTSNPSGPRFQDLTVAPDEPLYLRVAAMVDELGGELSGRDGGLSGVGAVVGATYPEVLKTLRAAMPNTLFLLPGIGAQGGKIQDLGPAFTPNGRGVLLTASRSIIYAYQNRRKIAWQEAARQEAETLVKAYRTIVQD